MKVYWLFLVVLSMLTHDLFSQVASNVYLYTGGAREFEIERTFKLGDELVKKKLIESVASAKYSKAAFNWRKPGYLIIVQEIESNQWRAYEWKPWSPKPNQLIPVSIQIDNRVFKKGSWGMGPDLHVPETTEDLGKILKVSLGKAIETEKEWLKKAVQE